jgi:hypothetical protein
MRKIKIVFNSNSSENIGSVRIPQVSIKSAFDSYEEFEVYKNDFTGYDKFDVAILHGDEDEIVKAREQNKNIIIGVAKPHSERVVHPLFHKFTLKSFLYQVRMFTNDRKSKYTKNRLEKLRNADFLLADTPHLKDYFESEGFKSIYVKLLEWNTFPIKTMHEINKSKIVFGYHGNARHFIESKKYIFPALEELSKKYEVILKVVSNIDAISLDGDNSFSIKLYEYSYPEIYNHLADVDIGLAPSQISYKNRAFEILFTKLGGYFWDTDRAYDHLFRYKESVNSGRAFVFAQLGAPFISCPVPEVMSIFGQEMSDCFPYNADMWKHSILRLADDIERRQAISAYLLNKCVNELNPLIEYTAIKDYILRSYSFE